MECDLLIKLLFLVHHYFHFLKIPELVNPTVMAMILLSMVKFFAHNPD